MIEVESLRFFHVVSSPAWADVPPLDMLTHVRVHTYTRPQRHKDTLLRHRYPNKYNPLISTHLNQYIPQTHQCTLVCLQVRENTFWTTSHTHKHVPTFSHSFPPTHYQVCTHKSSQHLMCDSERYRQVAKWKRTQVCICLSHKLCSRSSCIY